MAPTIIKQSLPTVAGANSYASVADLKARLDSQLRSYAGKTDEQLSAALIAATEYLDGRFKFIGYRVDASQTTEWPRQNAYNDRNDRVEGVPSQVVAATCEYAWRALSGELNPDLERDASGQAVLSKTESVGPVSESITYAAAFAAMPAYPAADSLLTRRGLVARASIAGLGVANTARG